MLFDLKGMPSFLAIDRNTCTQLLFEPAAMEPSAMCRELTGRGYKHLLSKSDIHEFIEIVPEWDQSAEGLDAILLAAGDAGCDGWYNHLGVVAICAWERNLWRVTVSGHHPDLMTTRRQVAGTVGGYVVGRGAFGGPYQLSSSPTVAGSTVGPTSAPRLTGRST